MEKLSGASIPMINPQVCRHCPLLVKIDASGTPDESGISSRFPTVSCSWDEKDKSFSQPFFLEEEPPTWCKYVTEHLITLGGVDTTEDGFWGPESNDAKNRKTR